jgi:hypothetical protein
MTGLGCLVCYPRHCTPSFAWFWFLLPLYQYLPDILHFHINPHHTVLDISPLSAGFGVSSQTFSILGDAVSNGTVKNAEDLGYRRDVVPSGLELAM